MKLRQMEIFRAVMRRQTTISAADELAVSQPAVSNAIKHLGVRKSVFRFSIGMAIA